MPSGAAQRDIPSELIYSKSELPTSFEDGAVLLIDKPKGPTSHDVVQKVRRCFEVKKVGHAGTLDPMATGLLVVLVGRPATRLQEAFLHLPKTYEGTVRLGETTRSHDVETEVVDRCDPSSVTREAIEDALSNFRGTIEQIPPMYSAVKVGGERLYKKARRGETVDRPPRQVSVYAFEVTNWNSPEVSFRVECSKGTYIRSLARDLGKTLGVGGHLVSLRRRSIGSYSAEEAWSMDALGEALS